MPLKLSTFEKKKFIQEYFRYVLYKLPKVSTSSDPLIRQGLAYLYITNVTVGTGWRLSTRSIGSNSSVPGITLAPLYDNVSLYELFSSTDLFW